MQQPVHPVAHLGAAHAGLDVNVAGIFADRLEDYRIDQPDHRRLICEFGLRNLLFLLLGAHVLDYLQDRLFNLRHPEVLVDKGIDLLLRGLQRPDVAAGPKPQVVQGHHVEDVGHGYI